MSRFEFPHPLVLLIGCLLVAAAASWVVPTGQYDRRDDPATGRRVVVAGTYHAVPRAPVGPFAAMVAIPKGMGDAASVIFLVFLVGGAFTVVDRTGALRWGVDWLVRHLRGKVALVVPIVTLAFATAGALEHLQEEIIALLPALLVLTRGFGMDALTAVSISLGAAAVGAAFSPIDPFQVGIAQKLAGLPLLSGALYRLAFLVPALGIWIWGTLRHVARTRGVAEHTPAPTTALRPPPRQGIVLPLVVLTFAVFIYGVLKLGWDFEQMSALFFVMGAAAGLIAGLGLAGTIEAFLAGAASMTYAALVIGFARAIYVVLDQGRIVDTLVHGLFTPLGSLPVALSAEGMIAAHAVVHVPVPSVSGQAVLTMPVLVPLSDLLGLSRQVTVLAYQYGAGLCELLTPTNGAMMAILAAAGVRYDTWLRFAVPITLLLYALGAIAVAVGIAINLQ
ncbi:MAG TPA: hypothetical protein VL563_08230 [Gemmatimonadales bacterium]|nr:hypothetical protein [Gemmatimonadales bacterium]